VAEFARRADPQGRKLLVLLLDNAGWHIAKRLAVPPNVALYRLPACTPEVQPVEPLWPLLREAVANRELADLAELEGRGAAAGAVAGRPPRGGPRRGRLPLGRQHGWVTVQPDSV
jgi:hypothetical protein